MDGEYVGYVYFIRCTSTGNIKIGYSARKPDDRFMMCSVGASSPLEKFALMRGSRVLERSLHERFGGCRVRGEWFKPGESLLAYIRENALGWEEMLNSEFRRMSEGFRRNFRIGDPSRPSSLVPEPPIVPLVVKSKKPGDRFKKADHKPISCRYGPLQEMLDKLKSEE